MQSSINLVFKFAFVVLCASRALGADAFCDDPEKYICSQNEIVSDQGTSKVRGGFRNLRLDDREPIMRATLRSLETANLLKAPLSNLTYLTKLLHLDPCDETKRAKCISEIDERIADYASRDVMLFEEEKQDLSPILSLREIETMRQLPLFQAYQAAITKASKTYRRSPALESQVQKNFGEMKKEFAKLVREWNVPQTYKAKMLERISSMTLSINGETCQREGVPVTYVPNARYQASQNLVTVCGGLFIATSSISSLALIVAHEMGHAVGPCFAYSFAPEGTAAIRDGTLEKIYGGLLSCLQESEGDARAPSFCDAKSKVNESFADWAGTELAARYLPGKYPTKASENWRTRLAGAWSYACGLRADDRHPATRTRFNEILFANRKVRSLVNCPVSSTPDCVMGSPVSSKSKPESTSSKGVR